MKASMYFQHSPEIWRRFPGLVPGVLVVRGVDPEANVEGRLAPWLTRAAERLGDRPESDLPEISAWRRAFSEMGLKPTQYRGAAEALLRRFRRERAVPRVHPLVDLCNGLSLAFAVPVAAFDLSRIDSFLEVRPARGDERYLAFSGELETPPEGEIVFADAAGHAHARRWTFRQSRESAVSGDTHEALIVAEGLHDAAGRDVAELIDHLAEEMAHYWAPPSERAILDATRPRLDFEPHGGPAPGSS